MGKSQTGPVTGREQLGLVACATVPAWTYGVNDMFRRQLEGRRDSRFADRTPNPGPHFRNGSARCEKLGPSCSMDSAVNATSAEHPFIRGVDDGIDRHSRDVTLDYGR